MILLLPMGVPSPVLRRERPGSYTFQAPVSHPVLIMGWLAQRGPVRMLRPLRSPLLVKAGDVVVQSIEGRGELHGATLLGAQARTVKAAELAGFEWPQ